MLERMRTGTVVARDDLTSRGFVPHALAFRGTDFSRANCEWDSLGTIPDSAGLYAFVLTHDDQPGELRVAYVGRTGNLWMVTKGRLPSRRWRSRPAALRPLEARRGDPCSGQRARNGGQAGRMGCHALAQRSTRRRRHPARAGAGTHCALEPPCSRMEPRLTSTIHRGRFPHVRRESDGGNSRPAVG